MMILTKIFLDFMCHKPKSCQSFFLIRHGFIFALIIIALDFGHTQIVCAAFPQQ